jgi:ABC-type Zn uptake system ZnuABC Zn-binding protein ZnuA
VTVLRNVLFILIIFTAGCSASQTAEKPFVVATTNIIADIVEQVAGYDVEVFGLISQGKDPHGYEPTPRDIARATDAAVVFSNGYGLEEVLIRTFERAGVENMVELSATIEPIVGQHHHHEGEDHDDHEGEDHDDDHEGEDHDDDHEGEDHDDHDHDREMPDPHVWMSPMNLIVWVDVIEAELSRILPDQAGAFKNRADAYKQQLASLDETMKAELATISEDKRGIISDHQVLGYLERDYGIEVVGTLVSAFSTNAESSAKELAELADVVKERGAGAIFLGESSGDAMEKLAEALQDASGADLPVLRILTGSLTLEGGVGDSYLTFMEYNLNQIMKGLQGEN